MADDDIDIVRRAWEAFGTGDVAGATSLLDPGVRWHGANPENLEDGCHNRGEAVAVIGQATEDGMSAEAIDVRREGERVLVVVQVDQPAEWGERPPPHGELVTVRNGLITEILVYETVEDAVTAASHDARAADER